MFLLYIHCTRVFILVLAPFTVCPLGTKYVFNSGVISPRVREHNVTIAVSVNILVLAGPSVRQQQLQNHYEIIIFYHSRVSFTIICNTQFCRLIGVCI